MNNKDLIAGAKDGLPVGLGYLSVSIAFGALAVTSGQPFWAPILTSITNFTGIGQIAGINLIASHASLIEIAFTLLVINIRYILMSLSLTQKIPPETKTGKRMLIAFGVTDENYGVAMVRKEHNLSGSYFFGLIMSSYSGWVTGTLLGSLLGSIIPEIIASALGIALYSMFIAIIVPEAKKSLPVLITSLTGAGISCLLHFIFKKLESGWIIIIAGVISAAIMSVIKPIDPPSQSNEDEIKESDSDSEIQEANV